MNTVTRKDLEKLGYSSAFSSRVIRESKLIMVSKGFKQYNNRKLDRVPVEIVQNILGITLADIDSN